MARIKGAPKPVKKSRSKVQKVTDSGVKRINPPTADTEGGSHDQEQECCICLDTLNLTVHEKIPCGHKFHQVCLAQWLVHGDGCPMCRKPVRQSFVSFVLDMERMIHTVEQRLIMWRELESMVSDMIASWR